MPQSKSEQNYLSADWGDDEVRSVKEWCRTANFSPATGRRQIKAGNGPTITRLSERRIGVTGRNYRAWLARSELRNNSPDAAFQLNLEG
jgi:hypothetical protein